MNPQRTARYSSSFSAPPLFLASTLLVTLFLSISTRISAQSSAPFAQQSQNQPAPGAQQNSASKAAPAPKPKKVFTNDDLEAHSAAGDTSGARIITGDSSSLLSCESACEQQARAQLGYDSDREGEWQMQIVNARRDLIADTEWRNLLAQTIQQRRTYCNFLAQQSQKTAPSNNSYNARVQRARNDQYFQDTDRTLRQGLEALANRAENKIQEANELSPVRAAMMSVQLSRFAERNCDLPR